METVMSTDFTLEFLDTYLSLKHPQDFEITREGQDRMWAALGKACAKYDCYKVLSECPQPPKRKMNRTDAFMSANSAVKIQGLKVSCWFPGYEPDETTEFFILSAKNRGVLVEFFNSRKMAMKWLGIKDDKQ